MQPQELTPMPQQLRGLKESEVAARRTQGLTNALPVKTSRTYLQIIGENVFTPINDILFALGLALVLLGQISDAVVSVTVVLLNVTVSVVQEVRAKRMLDRIALLNRPTTMVIRDGQQRTIVPEEVVVGDVLQVRPGDQIVVDGPILETERIDVDESLLTGESDLVPKQKGDRLYSGSFCVNGSALYQAEKVGAQSVAYGLAAGARAFRRIYTPLQREINLVIRVILLFALFFELLLLLGALASQLPTVETLKMAVVIIGLVPNGLFLSISVAYALGAVRIAGQGALVQQANSVESLSNVDVLCMDKTGTLTTNALRLERTHPLGIEESELRRLLGDYVASGSVGNTTSAAIGAACPGQARHVREELPFSSAYKWSGLVMDDESVRGTYILGAVEILAPVLRAGNDLQAMVEQESAQGLRVLLFTSVPELVSLRNADDQPSLPHGLIPLGLISLSDELRPQARETLRQLSETGVRFKVISGDNPQTVAALVKQAGLSSDISAVSGLDLATMDTVDFATTAADATVFGRITPQQKEQLVDVLHKQGHYVAMIGDGVNDVLSLKKADLAIAMQSGSQATRSVADIVLLNDSFASLPSALREGQRIRNGMQDILKLYLTRVFYFVVLLSGASVVGGFPFEPRQASILVLLTVGIPSFLLAAWARPGAQEKDARRSLWHFVLPAASTLGLVGLLLYFSEYVLADSLGLFRSRSTVAAVKMALDAQTTLTTFALFCGIALLLLVEPPARFWVGGNELRGDKRISYLALAMCIASVLLISLSPLRSLFALTLLDSLDYLVIAVYVVIWVFLVRWVWRGHIVERFLALE